MDARTRMLVGGAGVVVVIAAAAVGLFVSRGGERGADADAGANATANASASTSASANADAHANVHADVHANADAGDAGTGTGPSASAVASARRTDAGALETAADAGVKRSGTVNLDESGAGKTIELAPGQQLVLLLGASPTSGFDWAVMKAPAALGAPAMGFIQGGDAMGAPGKRRLTWTLKSALPAGEHGVELGYARSFEPGVPPFKTFRFKVRSP